MPSPFDHLRQDIDRFWSVTYPAYCREERLRYWTQQLGEGVKWERGAGGGDAYAIFSPEAWQEWTAVEPAFGELLPEICVALDLDEPRVRERLGAL